MAPSSCSLQRVGVERDLDLDGEMELGIDEAQILAAGRLDCRRKSCSTAASSSGETFPIGELTRRSAAPGTANMHARLCVPESHRGVGGEIPASANRSHNTVLEVLESLKAPSPARYTVSQLAREIMSRRRPER
jgi:hypothetical protein